MSRGNKLPACAVVIGLTIRKQAGSVLPIATACPSRTLHPRVNDDKRRLGQRDTGSEIILAVGAGNGQDKKRMQSGWDSRNGN